jgi:hypothetical protein
VPATISPTPMNFFFIFKNSVQHFPPSDHHIVFLLLIMVLTNVKTQQSKEQEKPSNPKFFHLLTSAEDHVLNEVGSVALTFESSHHKLLIFVIVWSSYDHLTSP